MTRGCAPQLLAAFAAGAVRPVAVFAKGPFPVTATVRLPLLTRLPFRRSLLLGRLGLRLDLLLARRVDSFPFLLLRWREGASWRRVRLMWWVDPLALAAAFAISAISPVTLAALVVWRVGLIPAAPMLRKRRSYHMWWRHRARWRVAPVARLVVPGLVAVMVAPVVADDEGDQRDADEAAVLRDGQRVAHPVV